MNKWYDDGISRKVDIASESHIDVDACAIFKMYFEVLMVIFAK